MPKNEPEAGDPMSIHGVELRVELDDVVEMARAFAEEFAAQGYDEPRLIHVFRSPYYAGPRLAWDQLGETRVRVVPFVGGGALQVGRSLEDVHAVLDRIRLILVIVALGGVGLAALLGRAPGARFNATLAARDRALESQRRLIADASQWRRLICRIWPRDICSCSNR